MINIGIAHFQSLIERECWKVFCYWTQFTFSETPNSIWYWKFVKLQQICYCSENRDIVVKILGPRFADVLEREDTQTDLVDEDTSKDSEVKVKLFRLLQTMDQQLLSKLLEEISE